MWPMTSFRHRSATLALSAAIPYTDPPRSPEDESFFSRGRRERFFVAERTGPDAAGERAEH